MSHVLYEKDGGIATITLNRPERLNAISGPMLESLSERLVEADRDGEVRVIVLTGAGRGFCSGLDLVDASSGSGIGSGGGSALPVNLDLRDAPPVVLGAHNWIVPPAELEDAFFPLSHWFLDVYHQQIKPLPGYTPQLERSVDDMVDLSKYGVC